MTALKPVGEILVASALLWAFVDMGNEGQIGAVGAETTGFAFSAFNEWGGLRLTMIVVERVSLCYFSCSLT